MTTVWLVADVNAVLTFVLARTTKRCVAETHTIASHNKRLVEETNRLATLTAETLNLQVAPIVAMNRGPKGGFRGASTGTYLHPEWINAGNGPIERQIGWPLKIRIERRDGTVIEFGSENGD